MSLENISLNRILKMSRMKIGKRVAIIKKEARDKVAKKKGWLQDDGGGNFYNEFWCDAKEFVYHGADLELATEQRIANNYTSKRKLYPVLLEGFTNWYEGEYGYESYSDRSQISNATGRCDSLNDNGGIRVNNLLAWHSADGGAHLIYPYFNKDCRLGDRTARLGLWAMKNSLSDYRLDDMKILDVFRGNFFCNDNAPLIGDEEDTLSEFYGRVLREYESQKALILRQHP